MIIRNRRKGLSRSLLSGMATLMCCSLSWGQSVTVNSNDIRQTISMMGGDMERSGRNFHNASNPQDVIDWCVKDINFDTWRVGYDKTQEMTEGVQDFSVYDSDVLAMQMMVAANPNIKFFATMESDYNGYSQGNRNNLPTFIYDYAYVNGAATGTYAFDADKYGIFLADYVEYMEVQGVPISYLSISKEWVQVLNATRSKATIEKLISECNSRGVVMPQIIDACTWSITQGINVANNYVSNGANQYIHGYSAHDYWGSETKTWGDFVSAANNAGKPAYADETGNGSPGWIANGDSEGIGSAIYRYIQKCEMYEDGIEGECLFEIWPRGINEINSNGFYAKPIFFDASAPYAYRMRAYYIMKEFVNNAVSRSYVTSAVDSMSDVHTMAFRQGDQVALWVINSSTTSYSDVPISLNGSQLHGFVSETTWTEDVSIEGERTSYFVSGDSFNVSIAAESMNCYILDVSVATLPDALVEYNHTAGASSPTYIVSGVSSSAALGGNLSAGTIATSIDQLSAASGDGLGSNIASTDFNHYLSYTVSSDGSDILYTGLSLDAYAKDANRRYQLSYTIAGQSEVFITSGQVLPGDLDDEGNFDVYDFADFTTASDVEVRVYWQGSAASGGLARVYVDDLWVHGTGPGLVALWSMDDGSGSTVADASGNGFDGTVSGATWTSGIGSPALDFNGSSSTVSLPASAFASLGDEVTISLWAYGGDGQPQSNSAFYAVDSSGNRVLNVHLPWSNGSVYWDAGFSGGYDRIYKGAALGDYKGQWNHWVFTKNASTGNMSIYLNGSLWHSGSGKTRSMSGIAAATIGSQISGLHYDGLIDDVQLYNVSLSSGDVSDLYNSYTVANGTPIGWLLSYGIDPTDASALADTDNDGLANWEEYASGNNPTVNDSSPGIRVTEYYLTTGDFTGTAAAIELNQDLASDYFILVRGSRDGNDLSMPNNDYARVYKVPNGVGDMVEIAGGYQKRIVLNRAVADFDWEGVVTVVECTNSLSASGFKLRDILVTNLSGTSGTDTSASWGNVNQVTLFGGYRGGGALFTGTPTSRNHGTSVYTRLYPSGTGTINWSRNAGGETLFDAEMATFVIEWGDDWNVQHVNVSGANGGAGADATGEYSTAAISSVNRANTWVWGTGTRADAGIGDSAEACLVTLGNGVSQNTSESTVAISSEYTDAYDFDVYTMTHADLAVDYRFKADGDSASTDLAVAVDTASSEARFGWSYNGCNGTGTYFPRPRMWARYTADGEITLSRGFSGQTFPAWVQGIDLSGLND